MMPPPLIPRRHVPGLRAAFRGTVVRFPRIDRERIAREILDSYLRREAEAIAHAFERPRTLGDILSPSDEERD
jgi:hypothetical protein